MDKITALVIDDERLARQELINLLSAYSEIEIIGECNNAESAIERINESDPNLIFLDIQMPGKNGFELLESIDTIPEVIFVTAYDEYAIKAFEVSAIDYLLKPIDPERLKEAIKKIIEKETVKHKKTEEERKMLTEKDQVFVKDGEKCWFVKLSNVRMFESYGNYVKVFFDNNHPLILKSLTNLEEKLDQRVFFRANRKHIINLNWVDKIENWFNGRFKVTLKNGDEIEVSRRQASKLKNMMSL